MWGWHLFWPLHGLGWGIFAIFGGVFRLLLIGGAVVAIVLVANHGRRTTSHHEDSALETLRRRYAAGEISKEEFDQKMKDLG
jgi:putative membrane protein